MAASTDNPELPDLIRRAVTSRLEGVNVAAPGIVESFDEGTQTATVRMGVLIPIADEDDVIQEEEVPPFQNVPVVWPRCGRFSITGKLVKGDTVLLVFNTRAPTKWRTTGVSGAPPDLRVHGLGYPVALPGYLNDTQAVTDTDESIGVPGGLRLHFTETAIKAGTGADYVAMSTKVSGEFTKLLATIMGLQVGGVPVVATVPYLPAPVVSSNLKAD